MPKDDASLLNFVWNYCREHADWDAKQKKFVLTLPVVAEALRLAKQTTKAPDAAEGGVK